MIPGLAVMCPATSFRVPAVTFDGTNDYLEAASLTGLADGKLGTVSFWIKLDAAGDGTIASGGSGSQYDILTSGDNAGLVRFQVYRNASGFFSMFGKGSGSPASLRMQGSTVNKYTSAAGWLHVLMSWDCGDGTLTPTIYVDDVAQATSFTGGSNGNILYTDTPYTIGADSNSHSNKLASDLAELWFDPSFIDLSVTANRRKFISAGGKPVDLGTTGQNPTGAAPLIYCSGKASSFANNLSGTGAFTTTGALADAATSPSD